MIYSSEGNIVDSVTANEGEPLNLVCQSKPPGSPPGELVWRWEQPADSPHSSLTDSDKLPSLDQYSRHTSDQNQLESHLSLPAVKRGQNGLVIVCVTRHKLGLEQKAEILLKVNCEFYEICLGFGNISIEAKSN